MMFYKEISTVIFTNYLSIHEFKKIKLLYENFSRKLNFSFRGLLINSKYYERSFAYPSIIAANTKLSRSLFGSDDLERGLYHLNFVDDSKGCVRSLKRKYRKSLLNYDMTTCFHNFFQERTGVCARMC